MKKSNLYFVTVMFLFCLVLTVYSGSGSYYWDDGEIVRGTKINAALDQKLNQTGETHLRLLPGVAPIATATALAGTIYINASGAINFLSTGTTWMTLLATTTGLQF